MAELIRRNCIYCGNVFYKYPSQCDTKHQQGKYCSKECADKARIGKPGKGPKKEWIKLNCITCNKEFKVTPCRKNDAKYCSFKCRKIWNKGKTKETDNRIYCGNKHHNWKGGITKRKDYLRKTNNYKYWRMGVFFRDNFTCQICNKVGEQLEAHHIIPVSKDINKIYDMNNGITLCQKCHADIDYYRSIFIEREDKYGIRNL